METIIKKPDLCGGDDGGDAEFWSLVIPIIETAAAPVQAEQDLRAVRIMEAAMKTGGLAMLPAQHPENLPGQPSFGTRNLVA